MSSHIQPSVSLAGPKRQALVFAYLIIFCLSVPLIYRTSVYSTTCCQVYGISIQTTIYWNCIEREKTEKWWKPNSDFCNTRTMWRRLQSSYGICLFASVFNGINGSLGRPTKAFRPSTHMWDVTRPKLISSIANYCRVTLINDFASFRLRCVFSSHFLLHWPTALSQWPSFVKRTAAAASE